MSLRNDHYLRLAHNSRRSTTDQEKTCAAGVAGVLVAAVMLVMLMVNVERPAVFAANPLRSIALRSLLGLAK